jgi:3-oxoadipate enol-lactonase
MKKGPGMAAAELDFVPGEPGLAYSALGEGPTVVFLHGVGGNRGNWADQLPAFAPQFRAVAWDARGYGDSADYAGPLDFADFSGDLLRLLDHLRVRRAHLCGLSMGGRIALDFYERHPARVATLVLCDSFAGFDADFTPERRAAFVRQRKEPLLQGKRPADIAPDLARILMGRKAPKSVFDRLVASMAALRKESYIKAVEATTMYQRNADLAQVAVPTLLVYGGDDRLTPPALGRTLAAQIRGARLLVIEEAGHLVNIEKPAEFNAAVLGFLREHRDRAA